MRVAGSTPAYGVATVTFLYCEYVSHNVMSRGSTPEEIFKECLAERGVTDVNVLHTNDEFSETLTVRKQTGDLVLDYRVSLDMTPPSTESHKEIALRAEEAARAINKKMVNSYEWDERCSQLSVYEGGWAECRLCGEEVETPPQRVAPAFTADAELTTPQPLPKEPDNYVSGMSGHQEVLLRMYLLGRLREHCPPECSNSKYNQNL